MDEQNGYKYMKNYLHSQNFFLLDRSFKRKDKFIIYFYYLSAIISFFSILAHTIFLIFNIKRVKTKYLYYYHFLPLYIWKFFFNMNFLWGIPICLGMSSPFIIFPLSALGFMSMIIFTCIIQDHNKVISLLNRNNDVKIIKNLDDFVNVSVVS